jgi:uncharacterized protein with GYD domain
VPTYVSLISWTEQGVKNARETTKRAEQAKAAARKLGGKLTTVLWTQGRYDLIAITEFPDEESCMAYLLALGGQGNLRTETLRAYNAADMERIFAKMDSGSGGSGSSASSSGGAGAASKRSASKS